jgi:hypothetical protein
MKANGLRPGNLLQRTDGSILTVRCVILDSYGVFVKEETGLFTFGYAAKSIPLNGELLIRIGFKAKDLGDKIYYTLGKNEETAVWIRKNTGDLCGCRIAWIDDIPIRRIQYVHKFQNLYYDLREKELITVSLGGSHATAAIDHK